MNTQLHQEEVNTKFKEDIFNKYLEAYQEDMLRIIHKHRRSNHILSVEEIASEANLLISKKKDHITSIDDFNENNFKKIAYAYVRNAIKWSAWRENDSKQKQAVVDGFMYDSDSGETLTTFDFALSQSDYSEQDETDLYDKEDRNKNNINFFRTFLNESECEIINHLLEEKSVYEIADIYEISRQAVDFKIQDIRAKIKNHPDFRDGFSSKSVKDETFESISKGTNAIDDFFNEKKEVFSDSDLNYLKNILLSAPKFYTAEEINKKYFNSKFSEVLIYKRARSIGLNFLMIRKRPDYVFNESQEKFLADLFESGCDATTIANKLGFSEKSIIHKQYHMFKKGIFHETFKQRNNRLKLLKRVFKSKLFDYRRPKKYELTDSDRENILNILKIQGDKYNLKNISRKLKIPLKVISGYRSILIRKKFLPKLGDKKRMKFSKKQHSDLIASINQGKNIKYVIEKTGINEGSLKGMCLNAYKNKLITKDQLVNFYKIT